MHACIDIAVGAPFDDGGKVFIYHGSNSNSIINTTVKQVCIHVRRQAIKILNAIVSENR